MTRTVFTGARVFDGTGSPPSDADVVVDGGRFAQIGTGLDGDERVDLTGTTLFPGFFDCHVHVMMDGMDLLRDLMTPFSSEARP